MAKSREKIQQLGFWDAEVSKPDHDAVCLWAYDNAEMIFRTVCPDRFDKQWLKDEVDNSFERYEAIRMEAALTQFVDSTPRPNPRITQKNFEYVLIRHTGYQDRTAQIVGYADLMIATELPCVVQKYKSSETGDGSVFSHFEVTWRDMLPTRGSAPRILVEAKPVMPTLGELMRQINLYRTAFGGKFVVVSPDDSFAEILTEQGVTFVKCNP